jgi:hypothetical protein
MIFICALAIPFLSDRSNQQKRKTAMNKLVRRVSVCAVLAASASASALACAQGPDSASRQNLNRELSALEQAGYDPGAQTAHYPLDIQHAQKRVAQQRAHATDASAKAPA